jgi:ribosome maturation factor RimP
MRNQGSFRRAFGALLMAVAVWGLLPVTPARAQDQEVRLQGRVSWIAGETLVVSTEDSPSVRVDLSQVDQAEYQTLAPGDLVIVIGIIPFEGDRVIATSITLPRP